MLAYLIERLDSWQHAGASRSHSKVKQLQPGLGLESKATSWGMPELHDELDLSPACYVSLNNSLLMFG